MRNGKAAKAARKAVADGTPRLDRPKQVWNEKDECWEKIPR